RLPGQQPEEHCLQPAERIGQAQDVTGKLCHGGGHPHELLECQDIRAAELVGLPEALRPVERADERVRYIANIDRLNARLRAREGHDATRQSEERGEAVGERVAWAEDDRWAEDGEIEVRGSGADELLCFALGSQVAAGSALPIRAGGAHLQQPADLRVPRGGDEFRGEIHMYGVEGGAAALVENADEVDHRVHPAEQLAERAWIVDVRGDELDRREDPEVLPVTGTACGYPHPVSVAHETRDELRTDEAGAAQHTDAHGRCHVSAGSGAQSRYGWRARGGRCGRRPADRARCWQGRRAAARAARRAANRW